MVTKIKMKEFNNLEKFPDLKNTARNFPDFRTIYKGQETPMQATKSEADQLADGFRALSELAEHIVRKALEDLVDRESKGDK